LENLKIKTTFVIVLNLINCMNDSKSLIVKQARSNENAQGFQNWNRQLAPTHEGMQSSMDDPTQLKSNELQYNPNLKLMAIQKMANDSTNNKPIIQLKALANRYSQQNQPTLQLKPNNSGLPDSLKSGVESLSGLSMDDVKVHYNSDKPAQLNAHAYAQGTDIHLASGQEKHLPHEAWHVVQQKQGRVQPTTMMKAKVPINDDQGLEKEADVMGARALQMKSFSLSDYRSEYSVQRKGVVQKAPKKDNKEKDWKSSKEKEWDVAKEKLEESMYGKRKVDDKESQGTSNYGWAEYHPDSKEEKFDEDGKKIQKFDEEFMSSPWFSASVGIEKVEATKFEMQQHKGIKKAFHVTTLEKNAASILSKIDPFFDNPASRFGGGFYVASDLKTCYAEIAAHEDDQYKKDYKLSPGQIRQKQSAVHAIEYDVNGGDLADCTTGELAKMVTYQPLAIEKKVREDKRDGLVFPSTKGSGNNIVLFQNFGILKPKSTEPTSAKEGFDQFKKEKELSEKMDKMGKNGDLSKIKDASRTNVGTI
jgi:hypothetical protein